MEGEFEFKRRGEVCPQLLNLIPTEDWMAKDTGGGGRGSYGGDAEEKKLQLSLAPPGAERWPPQKPNRDDPSLLSLAFANPSCSGTKRGFPIPQGFMHLQGMGGLGKELPFQRASGKMDHQQQGLERKACCSPAAHGETVKAAGASSAPHTRTAASVPVVGWPPIRSFRRNLASSSSSKPLIQSQEKGSDEGVKHENPRKGLFVKINMDGIPIGRKVDLNAHESYEKLSSAVEELFRDLLAAQKDPPGVRKDEDNQVFTGLLDGTGEYTLVYEDNEGDRMLVGDVPWEMFVSTAKRLRVLKSSELSSLSLGLVGRKRPSTDSSV